VWQEHQLFQKMREHTVSLFGIKIKVYGSVSDCATDECFVEVLISA